MDIRMPRLLRFVQSAPTGKDHICLRKQFGFKLQQFGTRPTKGGQFIHIVVDGDIALKPARESEGHRRVIPKHGAA